MNNKYLRQIILCAARLTALIAVLLLAAGCVDVMKPPVSPNAGTSEKTAITVVVSPDAQRTVFPNANLQMVANYELRGAKDGGAETEIAVFTAADLDASGKTILLEKGTWTFTLNAYDADEKLIFKGAAPDQILESGETKRVEFELLPVMEGSGDIKITVSFPDDIGITKVNARLAAEQDVLPVETGEGTVIYEKNGVNAGYHFVTFTLSRGNEQIVTASETVQVANGLASEKTITITKDDIKPDTPVLSAGIWANGSITTNRREQWFIFTAIDATQYIHASFGSLDNILAQVYDGEMNPLGDLTQLSPVAESYISLTANPGSVYYVNIKPTESYASGDYRLALNTAPTPPPHADATLSEGFWTSGDIPAMGTEQWFMFTASAATQFMHASFDTLESLDAQLYDGNGAPLGGSTNLNSGTRYFSQTLTIGQIYYVKVTAATGSGTYQIGFTNSAVPPATAISQLSAGIWANGDIPAPDGEQWFSFDASAGLSFIHADFDTLESLDVQLYDSGRNEVGSIVTVSSASAYFSRTVNTEMYYIRVTPTSGSGTYKIGFTTSVVPPETQINPLSDGSWASGDIPTPDGIQWFSFSANAALQFIHAGFDTLTSLDVELYNSSGNAVGSKRTLSSGSTYTSETVSAGHLYYVKVTPTSGSGTYKIGFTTSVVPPEMQINPLSANVWAQALAQDGAQWFKFSANADTQFIRASLDTVASLDVELYDSNGNAIGSTVALSSSVKYFSQTVDTGHVYYIKATPASGSGTYKIAFNTSLLPPQTEVNLLTENVWAQGDIPTPDGEEWFKFTATADTQFIRTSLDTLTSLDVELYNINGNVVGSTATLSSIVKYISPTVETGHVYYIKATPASGSGTYKIAFNTSLLPPETDISPLTAEVWAEGDISTPDGEQWFSFTATAAMQFIHAAFDTLASVDVEVYDGNGNTVGDSANLNSSTSYISQSVTSEQIYYIKVTPSSGSGTYEMAFNKAEIPPPHIELVLDAWVNGDVPTTGGEEWFSFTATAATQYVHVDLGTLVDLYMQMYDDEGNPLGSETRLFDGLKYISQTVNTGYVYYVKVRHSSSGSGIYKLGLTTIIIPPLPTPITELDYNSWNGGVIRPETAEEWFSFTAIADTQYIHLDVLAIDSLDIQLYDSEGNTVGRKMNLTANTKNFSQNVISGQMYYIQVTPLTSPSRDQWYRILFNSSSTPRPYFASSLAVDRWHSVSLDSFGAIQWFEFTATGTLQVIHGSPGMDVQIYNSEMTKIGSKREPLFYITAITGDLYYMQITRTSYNFIDYKIAFNESTTPPN